MNQEEYERDLRERQRQHLESIRRNQTPMWRPCMHDQCPQCHGTGMRATGGACIHGIACPCPKCSCSCSTVPDTIKMYGTVTYGNVNI